MKTSILTFTLWIAATFCAKTFSVMGAALGPWTEGHGDLGVAYENGEFIWTLRNGEPPSDLSVALDDQARLEIPDVPAFAFLGDPGDPIWILPHTESDGVPHLGLRVDVPSGTFVGNRLALLLTEFHGPGGFLMWSAQSASNVEVLFNSRDGVSDADAAGLPAPGHAHRNWGFTAPGTYNLGFAVDGTLASSGESVQGESGPAYRFQVNVLDRGEADLEIAYDNGEWEWAIHDESRPDVEFIPGEAALHAGPAAWQVVPDGFEFAFLGRTGDPLFVLPQEEREGVLFLGIAGDEIAPGTFVDDRVDLNLLSLEGPGDAFLYGVDPFGVPTVFFNSEDGIDGEDSLPVDVGGHSHLNWAFTQPGFYKLVFQAEAVLAGSGSVSQSEAAELHFEAFEPEIISEGELDLEVVFEDGMFEVGWLDEANDREIRATEAVVQGGPEARQIVPEEEAFAFLGNAGAPVFVLPQEENEALPFVGIAGDEIETVVFENDSVSLQLKKTEGPGDVFLYAVDAFGAPEVFFNTADGIGEGDAFPVAVGNHSHQNWAFTKPGVYRLELQVSAVLSNGGQSIESQIHVVTFHLQNSISNLALKIESIHENSMILQFNSQEGKSYQLQSRTGFGSGAWVDLGPAIVGEPEFIEISVPIDSSVGQELFRVVER